MSYRLKLHFERHTYEGFQCGLFLRLHPLVDQRAVWPAQVILGILLHGRRRPLFHLLDLPAVSVAALSPVQFCQPARGWSGSA